MSNTEYVVFKKSDWHRLMGTFAATTHPSAIQIRDQFEEQMLSKALSGVIVIEGGLEMAYEEDKGYTLRNDGEEMSDSRPLLRVVERLRGEMDKTSSVIEVLGQRLKPIRRREDAEKESLAIAEDPGVSSLGKELDDLVQRERKQRQDIEDILREMEL